MRCPDCAKMVSYDTEVEPEEESAPTVEGTVLTATYRRVLACADCGTELKSCSLEVTAEVDLTGEQEVCKSGAEGGEHEFDVEDCSSTPTERIQDKDRYGKRIKSSRYMKKFYGVEGEAQVTCSKCDLELTVRFSAEEQARAFEEC